MQPHPTPRRRLRRFGRDDRGTAAIEFAFVAGPFLFMMFAVIELALVFLLSTSLDAASDKATRRVRTGQFQNANETAAQFKTAICDEMTWLADGCQSRLIVRVKTYTTYPEITADTTFTSSTRMVAGKREAKVDEWPAPARIGPQVRVIVRGEYQWPLITPFLNSALARLDNGKAIISSTQVFMTEPYE